MWTLPTNAPDAAGVRWAQRVYARADDGLVLGYTRDCAGCIPERGIALLDPATGRTRWRAALAQGPGASEPKTLARLSSVALTAGTVVASQVLDGDAVESRGFALADGAPRWTTPDVVVLAVRGRAATLFALAHAVTDAPGGSGVGRHRGAGGHHRPAGHDAVELGRLSLSAGTRTARKPGRTRPRRSRAGSGCSRAREASCPARSRYRASG